MAARRTERLVVVLGSALVAVLVGLIASGAYLKWLYRPTTAAAWTDIRTLRSQVHASQVARTIHRWLARLVAVVLPIYVVIYAIAGTQRSVVVRRGRWVTALAAIVAGLIGPSTVVWSLQVHAPLRRWYVVHEAPAYALVAALVFAVMVRPRSRRAEPPNEPATPRTGLATAAEPADDAQRRAPLEVDPTLGR